MCLRSVICDKIPSLTLSMSYFSAIACLNFYFVTPAIDRSPRDSRELSHQQRDHPPDQQENGEEEEELDEEGEMMKKIMGFSRFDSTKV